MSMVFYIIILVFDGNCCNCDNSLGYSCGGGFVPERIIQTYNIFFYIDSSKNNLIWLGIRIVSPVLV